MEENKITQQLEGRTYEIIQERLQTQKNELQKGLNLLNEERKKVFGSLETKLIANSRINTENNCVARDIVTIGSNCIFGYNVHFGLRTEITLSDVFSIYAFEEDHFVSKPLELIHDASFINDFTNVYKYYRNTVFTKFAVLGNYLHMVFQLSDSLSDIKTFKWLIEEDRLTYIDNRSEHEYTYPKQHDFNWVAVTRDEHRYGSYSHISILDTVFVETIGGDLTIKIEDNTDEGKGIYSEPVDLVDQTLDDGQFRYAAIGNLIVLEIKPFQEKERYFVFNRKNNEVHKIASIKDACLLLPDDQGIIYPNGYYLQTGTIKTFSEDIGNIKFQKKITSSNGEDYLYVFYQNETGLYILMTYNTIEQSLKTQIHCHGFMILQDGKLCYFKTENEQTKHHTIQIWQTSFVQGSILPSQHTDSLLYKIGNKDIVRAMAECYELITLLNKEDSYSGLYDDIAKLSIDIVDSYYWIKEEATFRLDIPLLEVQNTANAAIDEFEKVTSLRKKAAQIHKDTQTKVTEIFGKIKSRSFRSIQDFVEVLSQLRMLQGEVISIQEVRYIDLNFVSQIREQLATQIEKTSRDCVRFLLDDKALIPYRERIDEKKEKLDQLSKGIEVKALEEEVIQIAKDLEMLIEIVSNLKIEDPTHATKIIDQISVLFSTINQLKAALKNKFESLQSKESQAEFTAQLTLIDQSIINYLDMATTPEKTDELLNKVAVQLEDLESKFAAYDTFITQIMEKREEVYSVFDAKKNSILEVINKKAIAIDKAASRMLKGIAKKAARFQTIAEINGYFASDLMVSKLRDSIDQLNELGDTAKSDALKTALKVAKEDAFRQLKDKQDLYQGGDNLIKLGGHMFSVNTQTPDITIIFKNEQLVYHITGTDFYQEVKDQTLLEAKKFWDQEFISENHEVYRSEYLAYKLFRKHVAQSDQQISVLANKKSNTTDKLSHTLDEDTLKALVKNESNTAYADGYVKGVHDTDALAILKVLIKKHHDLGILKFDSSVRAYAQYFWQYLHEDQQTYWVRMIQNAAKVKQLFPQSNEYKKVLEPLAKKVVAYAESGMLFDVHVSTEITNYLFYALQESKSFLVSKIAKDVYDAFMKTITDQKAITAFENSITLETKRTFDKTQSGFHQIQMARQWVRSYLSTSDPDKLPYSDEVVCIVLYKNKISTKVIPVDPLAHISGLSGNHPLINEGAYTFNYHEFIKRLTFFIDKEVPAFEKYRKAKHQTIEAIKQTVKLHEFKPRVLSSFIRNKLIDQVYLPLFGDNFAKQLGSAGDTGRTDRMGLLLLISPPGYGKTTLMEYLANRLGLIFMKINGPAIGHHVTSVDPSGAKNAAAQQELKKLNLALEMGNNVMLYLDDIQHCNPEFLQKFISLADGTRTIEGVYNGQPKTYDLRNKRFTVVMAGNPYTESGDKFQIPDMLANRADIYNLGDIIGNTEDLFKLSLIENSVVSNPVLRQLNTQYFEDIYKLITRIETQGQDGNELSGKYTQQELQDYLAVLEKVLFIRDIVLKVNKLYIQSAGISDAYRTEPAFKLQGSYRDMSTLVAKVVPIMNTKELKDLIHTHYKSESQTLTHQAEANLLKFKQLFNTITDKEIVRWEKIKETFVKNNDQSNFTNQMHIKDALAHAQQFNEHLKGIFDLLKKQ